MSILSANSLADISGFNIFNANRFNVFKDKEDASLLLVTKLGSVGGVFSIGFQNESFGQMIWLLQTLLQLTPKFEF